MIKFNSSLVPFAFLYGLAVWIRNRLFDRKLLPAERFPVPVICVGNIAAGGTGKTPHIEYLVRLLQPRCKVAVLSRGYKRKTSGFLLADTKSSSEAIGDEPAQLVRKFPNLLLAVDADRRRGIRNLLALPEAQRPEVILLDDGFQHRYVTPSLSVILTDYSRCYCHDRLLPVGRLREPTSELHRADIVIVTKCPTALQPIDFRILKTEAVFFAHQQLFFTEIAYGNLKPVFPKTASSRTLEQIKPDEDLLLFSAIAAPRPFTEKITGHARKAVCVSFPDHSPFGKQEFHKLKTLFDSMPSPSKLLVTTEKDAARLINNPRLPKEWKSRLYVLPVTVRFCRESQPAFDSLILKHIETYRQTITLHKQS